MDADTIDHDLLKKHLVTAQAVRAAMDAGLSATALAEGVRLSHQEYLDLVRRAYSQKSDT